LHVEGARGSGGGEGARASQLARAVALTHTLELFDLREEALRKCGCKVIRAEKRNRAFLGMLGVFDGSETSFGTGA
jgi:hypothetical protein